MSRSEGFYAFYVLPLYVSICHAPKAFMRSMCGLYMCQYVTLRRLLCVPCVASIYVNMSRSEGFYVTYIACF